MRERQLFCKCPHCGNIVGVISGKAAPLVCCGEKMAVLAPNTADAALEKHVPSVSMSGGKVTVKVGSAAHPMEEPHHISFVYLETERGGQRKCLGIGSAPETEFCVAGDDKPLAVFAYCNLHGLWMTETFGE
ncbi:MAG: desulfoferrodoxin [Oscillospiraceae bacterium]|jgi:superoxide reductase|nr:desulfoferrodoxin [Oscillospiraceae bacterium]